MTKLQTLTVVAALAIAGFATSAQAAFTTLIQIGVMKDALGVDNLEDGTFVMYDAGADGILGTIGATDSYETTGPNAADDNIVDILEIGIFFGQEGFLSGTFGPHEAQVGNTIVGAFYNDGAVDGTALGATPGVGTEFGIVPLTILAGAPGDSGIPWQYATTEVFGTNAPETLFANDGTVAPEPTALALLGLGGLVLARRRK